ncbi:MAG: radical SAM protein [Alphaproteobacteria bacterium]|nr:radical SAM protein [Alphaproteobacteria bacterium]
MSFANTTQRDDARRHALRVLPAPTPSAGLEAYRRERELTLAACPRKQANYTLYEQSSRRVAAPSYLPIKLDIENVSRCNFRCTMCSVSGWHKGKRADDLTLAAFKKLIDEQIGLVEIKLQGLGEPLLQRDDYFAMIRYARDRHIWVRTTTNASLLHLKGNAEKLVAADPNEVQISIDGATRPVFESVRRGSVFDRVIENCVALNTLFAAAGKTRTKMWTVVQRANLHQLEDLVRLAARSGFRHHTFSLELVDWGLNEWRAMNEAVNVEAELDPKRLMDLVYLGEDIGVEVRFWHTTETYSTHSPETLCPWPFERSYMSSDRRVVPCCTIGNPDVCQIGSTIGENNSMSQHWFGPDYAVFRRAHLDGVPPEVCRACYAKP